MKQRKPDKGGRRHAQPANSQPTAPLKPNSAAVAAVRRLAKHVPDVRALFDQSGEIRSLTTEYATGLYSEPMLDTPDKQAQQFLSVQEVSRALSLGNISLARPRYDEVPNMGYRVAFPQEVETEESVRYRVFESFVHVLMDASGKVYEVNSTVSRAQPKLQLNGIISEEEALDAAKRHLGDLDWDLTSVEPLVFAEHETFLVPAYPVRISANNPRKVKLLLVTAHDGKVILDRDRLKTPAIRLPRKGSAGSAGSPSPFQVKPIVIDAKNTGGRRPRKPGGRGGKKPALGRAFLRIPDPNTPISKQLFDVVLEGLPDPKVLKNDNLIMYVGGTKTPVKAIASGINAGTYNYPLNSREFCAVVVFFALNAQIEYMKTRGLKAFPKPIPVFVEDRSVTDNAYFDPEAYEIHIGIGTGLKSGGLNRYIAYDYGVEWHEDGHNFVFVQTPGNDLPGTEGGGIHEAIGDMCDLLMDWLFRDRYAQQLGHVLTVADIEADPRIIGLYALPPDGIRIQKNTKKTPGDKTGEPHDDGLIVGGAMADVLVGIIKREGVKPGLDMFATLMLGALAIVPAKKVDFRDLLNAFLTADSKLNANANKDLITQSFGDHGITLSSSRRRRGSKVPVIILNQDAA